ncbi:MAG: acyltransferase [Barnesiella sp.]|nr:acyltransferase [Barnesiella sp.]
MNSKMLYIAGLISSILPETRCFGLKRWLYSKAGVEIGLNVRICSSAMIIGSGRLSIGDNTWVGHRCLISSSSEIKIGANCDIAPNVYIGTGTHAITPDDVKIGGKELSADVCIGAGCWICANSVILPGVTLGDKCIVAAGSVVKQSYDGFSIIAGIPANLKKSLK